MRNWRTWGCAAATILAISLSIQALADRELRLKTGDIVHIAIMVPSADKAYGGNFKVQSDGAIYGVGFGRISVAGRTVGESQVLLREALKRLVNPQEIFLTLRSEVIRRVFIVGAVGNGPTAGTVEIIGSLGLRQALAGLVGFKDADLLEARVYREGKEISKVNVGRLLNGSESNTDSLLEADDVVSIASVPTVRVWVTGSVRNPGPQVVPADASVDQAIAQAGGTLLPETNEGFATRGEYRVLLRRGTIVTTLPIFSSSPGSVVPVEAGDTITIQPPVRNRIVIAGEVRSPGEIVARAGISLVTALAQAGGVTAEGSAAGAIVYRNGEPILVSADISGDGHAGLDFKLQDGDTVTIRKNRRAIYVFGEVLHQGRYPLPEERKLRVTDALALSGGISSTGTLRRVYLARPGKDGRFQVTQFNLDEFIKDGNQRANPELEPDDVLLFGPPRPQFLTSVTQVIGTLLFIDSIYGSSGLSTIK